MKGAHSNGADAPVTASRQTPATVRNGGTKVGAFHSAELAYVFGTQASIERLWQPRDRELAEQVQLYWTNFARTGDPNGNGLPIWQRFEAASETVMELGDLTRSTGVLDTQRKALFDAYLATRLPQRSD